MKFEKVIINNKQAKVRIFEKKDLIQKLGLTQDEVKLVMKYQKTFPELLLDIKGFVIDGRTLWEQLDKPQGKFTDWIKRKIIKKGFEENLDYTSFRKIAKREIGASTMDEYTLSIETAKNVAMMENTDKGKLVRSYFILMEKTLRDMSDWIKEREPQREINKRINSLLTKRNIEINRTKTHYFVYSCNADMANLIAFGYKAKEINDFLEEKNDGKTRDRLTLDCLDRLTFILEQHELLIGMGMNFDQREKALLKMYKLKFNDTQLDVFTDNIDKVEYERPSFWSNKYLI